MTSAHSDQRSWTRMREIHRVITVHSEEQEIDFVNCLVLSTTVNPKKHWTRTDCELLKVIHRWHVCFCKNWCKTKRAKFSLKYPKDRSQKRVFGYTARSIHRINKRTRSTQSIQSTWYTVMALTSLIRIQWQSKATRFVSTTYENTRHNIFFLNCA